MQLAEKQLGSKNFKKIISSIPIPSFLSVCIAVNIVCLIPVQFSVLKLASS